MGLVWELVKFLCASGCSVGRITAQLTYYPPQPATYDMLPAALAHFGRGAPAGSDRVGSGGGDGAGGAGDTVALHGGEAGTEAKQMARAMRSKRSKDGFTKMGDDDEVGGGASVDSQQVASEKTDEAPTGATADGAQDGAGATGAKGDGRRGGDGGTEEGRAAAGASSVQVTGGENDEGEQERKTQLTVLTGGSDSEDGQAYTMESSHVSQAGRKYVVRWYGQPALAEDTRATFTADFCINKKGEQIPLFIFAYPGATHTVLFSHGNAADMGMMRDQWLDLCLSLQVNVVGYDYQGYGAATGTPTEKGTYDDVTAVYKYIRATLSASSTSNDIIVYGQSVGSGPSCYVASKFPCAGLILHSAFMSGLRVLTSNRLLCCFDVYPNMKRLQRVKCPVLVMHGRADEEVPFHHAVGIMKSVPAELMVTPWLPKDGGHNDLYYLFRFHYIARLYHFIHSDLGVAPPTGAPPVAPKFLDPLGRAVFRVRRVSVPHGQQGDEDMDTAASHHGATDGGAAGVDIPPSASPFSPTAAPRR